MKCKKEGCGADLGPDAQFCSDCGTKVTTTLIKRAICPSCNYFVLEVYKFCLKCGTQVDPALFTDKVCSGTKKDGGKCNTVLASGANFCLSCGISTLQADVTAVSREVMVASQKDHISVPITDSTEILNDGTGDSSRPCSNSPAIWVPPDDVNTSDQSEILTIKSDRKVKSGGHFDDIQISTDKLTHLAVSRPKGPSKRPPSSVFNHKALKSRFDTIWQEFVNKKDYCSEDRIKFMTNALSVIYLLKEHSLTLSQYEGSALNQDLLQMLTTQLVEFVKSGIKILSPNWIFCMPMIHFLFNQCCPGEKPPDIVNHDSLIPEWWGIAKKGNYEFDLKEFKKKPIERPLLEEILVILAPYFEVDYLLPRTLMACLTLEQLPIVVRSGLIPPDITLASLCFHVRKESQIFKNSDKEMAIIDCLTSVNSKFINLKEDAERSTEVLSCALRSFLIAADVIKSMHECIGNKLTDNVMSLALESFLISLHVYYTTYNVLTETTGEQKRMEDYRRVLDSVRSSTSYWLNGTIRYCKRKKLLARLKSWNRVLNVAVPEGVIKDEFIKSIADTLYDSLIDKNFEEEEVVKVYCKNQGFFCNEMLNILTKYAFGAIEKMCSTFTCIKKKEGQLKNLEKLLSTMFEEKVGELNFEDVSSILPFLLYWIPFPIFVKMFNNNIHAKFLSDKCVALIKKCNCSLIKVVEEINDRSVSVVRLRIIKRKQEHLCSIITDIPELDAKEFKISLQLRLAEMNAYNECIRNLKKFIDICQRCDANTSKLEEQIKGIPTFDRVYLKNICDKGEVPKDIKKYQPKVIAFEVDRYILDTLPELIRCTKGNIFIIIWDKFATEFHKTILRTLEIDELIEHVWKPTFEEWEHLHHRLKTGEILFSELESICGRFDQKTLKREFLLLEGVESDEEIHWIQERIDQMNKYRNLQNCLDGASVIMDVVEEFELEGNFNAIEQILKLGKGKDTKMNKLKPSYLKTCDIDKKKINCLEKFKECKHLVNWLRETMPDGLQELKVFVDLACISAGDDGMEIDKFRCLQSAAIGYAPLIFNLDPNCDYQVFLDRCKEVWKALDSNPNLPNELEDTNNEIEWLKKIVKKSHGSVEVTSLAQAEAINTSGIIYRKCEKGKGKATEF